MSTFARGTYDAQQVLSRGSDRGGNRWNVCGRDASVARLGTANRCSQQDGTIAVNIDRNPVAISQTLVHEQQHVNQWGKPAGSEGCARRRAVLYVNAMRASLRHAGTLGNYPIYTSVSGFSQSGCGF